MGKSQRAAQESQALDRDLLLGRLDFAPDGGGFRDEFDVGGERLDDDVAGVTDVLESAGDAGPVDVVVAGSAAVAAARMEVSQQLAGLRVDEGDVGRGIREVGREADLGEIVAATKRLIDDPELTNDDLCETVKGPDFPGGATIYRFEEVRNVETGKTERVDGIRRAYATGRGRIVMRA